MASVLDSKVQAQSLVDIVAERLEGAIIEGRLEPGAKLSEQGLAASLGVSRGPLREAIRRLEGRKLLERTPNIGVRVARQLNLGAGAQRVRVLALTSSPERIPALRALGVAGETATAP